MKIMRGVLAVLLFISLNGCFYGMQPINRGDVLAPHAPNSQVAACIRNPECHHYFIVAHRGDGFGKLENSRAGVEAAIAHGIRFIEIDLWPSSDGKAYVYHDPELGRTSNGSGMFSSESSLELSRLKLVNGETIPLLGDIYRITRGKAILILDLYGGVQKSAFEWITSHGSFDDVIFFTDTPDEVNFIAGKKKEHKDIMMLTDANSYKELLHSRDQFGDPPEIVQLSFMPTLDQVRTLRKNGVKIYMSLAFENNMVSALNCFLVPIFKYGLEVDFLEADRPSCL